MNNRIACSKAATIIALMLGVTIAGGARQPEAKADAAPAKITGFRNSEAESEMERRFLQVPNAAAAGEALKTLTQAPHMAGTPEDKATADYVAQKFRENGLAAEIVEYRVWINYPEETRVELTAPAGVHMQGPTRENLPGDKLAEDPRVVVPFNAMAPSGDATADVVYANYGRPEDFKKLDDAHIDVRGKIVLTRYGQNFRGVKVLLAQQHGAAGVLIYSDPADDGWAQGDKYPKGPWRPDTGVQRGSVGFIQEFAGDPTTPGVASVPDLEDSKRIVPERSAALPKIPVIPISYADAWPILQNLAGPTFSRDWQGALPFTYHIGPGPARVAMHSKQNFALRTIWDVIGTVKGANEKEWVVAGNHRDAWVYGAVDPGSGTAAMLEAVHGLGALIKSGWKPKRSIVIGSWDAEEFGLMGSTEWAEQHESDLKSAVAYFNMDAAVTGPSFWAAAVPGLKPFVREVAEAVPSPEGGSVYDHWDRQTGPGSAKAPGLANVSDLGSGSDYSAFIEHLGVPSTDAGTKGPYGVYHSAFDNFEWFSKFGDPAFKYEQEMARFFGLEILRMADADELPYDYESYGREVITHIQTAQQRASVELAASSPAKDFNDAESAAKRFTEAGAKSLARQRSFSEDDANLLQVERDLLIPEGLPRRPWYRHAIYDPGEMTGYAAVPIAGVNEAIDRKDTKELQQQLNILTGALNRATKTLEKR